MKKTDVCIIGGGASGFMAAFAAAEEGANVLIVERLPRVLKKILATGNGRCNITNAYPQRENYHGDVEFAEKIFQKFGKDDTIDFFEGIGLLCSEEDGGKMYPMSLQAASVSDLFRLHAQRMGIEIITDFYVKKAERDKNGFKIQSDSETIFSKNVVICCGGYASPSFGTDGSGAKIAKMLGHTITKVYPALVQLKCENAPKALKGVKHFCTANLYIDGKKEKSIWGEVLFTEYGLSGPPIFNMSRDAAVALGEGKKVEISLDMMPHSFKELCDMLEKRKKNLPDLEGENFLNSLINKKIGFEIVKKHSDIKSIASALKNYRHTVVGTTGFNNAQTTAGGVKCSEIYENMMSKKVKGVYFAGEVLNIDGDCGGFNLQWAWSSGYVAGKGAAGRKE